ncbi:MAG: ABC transporter permease, partial [Candidatus Latescibacteria bacterium]|nr:ABC transporter permease [Candidatus Latescibacterota bacterium]
EVLLPVFNALMDKELSLDLDPILLGALVGLALLVSLGAGAYPALVQSRFHPAVVLKGKLKLSNVTPFGRGLVIVQFSLSILLVISTLVMLRQLRFIRASDLGFDKEQVVLVNTGELPELGGPAGGYHTTLRNSFLQHSQVASVAMLRYPLWLHGSVRDTEAQLSKGPQILVQQYLTGYDLLKTLGMKLRAGRDFSRDLRTDVGESIIINQTLADQLGGNSVVGESIRLAGSGAVTRKVIGVVEDFHFESLHHRVQPTVLVLNKELEEGTEQGRLFLVRIRAGGILDTIAYMEKKWREIVPPGRVFQYSFLDEDLARFYQEENRWGKIVSCSALLAIFIACLGAFGLTSLVVVQRTKEIGIRKVLGASVPSIVSLLGKEFTYLVLAANLIAWPIAWYAMHQWLESFAYRIDLGPGVFVLGGALVLIVAWLTVSYQASRAARSNPVDALRYE